MASLAPMAASHRLDILGLKRFVSGLAVARFCYV